MLLLSESVISFYGEGWCGYVSSILGCRGYGTNIQMSTIGGCETLG